jgi:hypothetical protein
MNYSITQSELTCINILIRIIQTAMDRNCFDEEEKEKIIKTVEILTSKKTSLS